jgi:hypothetical protein
MLTCMHPETRSSGMPRRPRNTHTLSSSSRTPRPSPPVSSRRKVYSERSPPLLTTYSSFPSRRTSSHSSMTRCIAVKSSVPQGMIVCFDKEVGWCVGIAAILVVGRERCMVAHCSNMQDLSRRTIPRRLQDTAPPSHPRYDSPIPRFTMPGASFSIPTASLPHIRTHTATPDPLPHYARPQDTILTALYGYIGTLLYLHSLTSASAVHMATTSR